MGSLTDALYNNMNSSMYPLHMPGHKRRAVEGESDILSQIRGIDVTEVEGMDDLHRAQGVISDVQDRCRKLWGSDESRILVNGSSCGVLAGIMACMCRGGKLLMGRNSHKSAYNAVNIGKIRTEYFYPETLGKNEICGAFSPEEVERILAGDSEIAAVYITSPTYEGVISPVREIADVCHRYGLPLIVDAAHGAHFGLYTPFEEKYGMKSAIRSGADISIESLHKTLPAFTQSGVLHYRRGLIDEGRLNYYLSAFQSTSPSYILMAGIDRCLDILEKDGEKLFAEYEKRLDGFYKITGGLEKLHVLTAAEIMRESKYAAGIDIGKIVISGRGAGVSGSALADMLRRDYLLETEMSAGGYVLAMTSIMDSSDGLERLAEALISINGSVVGCEGEAGGLDLIYPVTESRMTIAEAFLMDSQERDVGLAEGMVSADFIFSYPPGIPLIAPGEIISREIIESIERMERDGVVLRGIDEGRVRVING